MENQKNDPFIWATKRTVLEERGINIKKIHKEEMIKAHEEMRDLEVSSRRTYF